MEQLNSLVPGESALSSKAVENFLPYFDIQPDQCNISVNVETLKSVFLKAYSYVSQPSEMMCEIPSLKPGVQRMRKLFLMCQTTGPAETRFLADPLAFWQTHCRCSFAHACGKNGEQ